MTQPWENSSGEIIEDSGAPVECSVCPCAAPASCPCSPWPDPATSGDFPCGGLEYEYDLTAFDGTDTFYDDLGCTGNVDQVDEFRIDPTDMPVRLTAVGGESCTWDGTGTLQKRTDTGSGFGSWTDLTTDADIEVTLNAGTWELTVDALLLEKLIGPEPNGDFEFNQCDDEVSTSQHHDYSATIEDVP